MSPRRAANPPELDSKCDDCVRVGESFARSLAFVRLSCDVVSFLSSRNFSSLHAYVLLSRIPTKYQDRTHECRIPTVRYSTSGALADNTAPLASDTHSSQVTPS